MTAKEHTMQKWREASQDLGFDFIAPFTLPDGDDTLMYLGLVSEFGSTRGTLIIPDEEPFDVERQRRFCRVAREHDYGYSCMSLSHEPYNREVMIELLNEWGWCGAPQRTPSWYVEQPDDDNDA